VRLSIAFPVAVGAAGLVAALAACDWYDVRLGHRDGSSDCLSCHWHDYERADHHPREKPTACAVCHVQAAWSPTGLYHAWPLLGAHERAKCFDCHAGTPAVFQGTAKACAACHEVEFEDADDHVGHFARTCEDCHTTKAWWALVPDPKWPAGDTRPHPTPRR
jgi:hypothetical protein